MSFYNAEDYRKKYEDERKQKELNEKFIKIYADIDKEFRFRKMIEESSFIDETKKMINLLWKYNFNDNLDNVSYDYFNKRIKEYLSENYQLIETDKKVGNIKIKFWCKKVIKMSEKEIFILNRDLEDYYKIVENYPKTNNERIENLKIKLENKKQELSEFVKRNKTSENGRKIYLEKEIENIELEIKEKVEIIPISNLRKDILPFYKEYVLKEINRIDEFKNKIQEIKEIDNENLLKQAINVLKTDYPDLDIFKYLN